MSEPIAATIYTNQLINQKEGYPVWEPDPQDEPAVDIRLPVVVECSSHLSSIMSEPIAATIYANQLINQKEGYPVWEPDPQDEPAVEIADVGYFKNGAFVRLFNASKEPGDASNKFGVPESYIPLEVGEIQKRNSLPAHVPIRSESVIQRGAQATLSAGAFIQAGGGFNFECSKQQGAVLILGDGADRRDALRLPPFFRYMNKHYSSWLKFANEVRQRGIALDDLILVTGCDLTSAWACAAFSGKSNQAAVSFQVGPVGIAQGGISMWGAWSNCSSVTARWGPQSRFFSTVPQINPLYIQDPRDHDDVVLMEGSQHDIPSVPPPVPRNQCVFMRGYRICDKQTMLARLFIRRKKKLAYDGFYYISRDKNDEEDPDSSGTSGGKKTEQGGSGAESAQPPSSAGSSGAGGTGSSGSESGGSGQSEEQSPPSGDDSLDDEYLGDLNHFLDKEPTPLDVLVEYILDSSSAKVAIVHDNDLIALLQDSPHTSITDFERWIRAVAPIVTVDPNQVGILEATYRLLASERQAFENLSPLATRLPTAITRPEETNRVTGTPVESQHHDLSQLSDQWPSPAGPSAHYSTNTPLKSPRSPNPQFHPLPPIRAVLEDVLALPPSHAARASYANREFQGSTSFGHPRVNVLDTFTVYRISAAELARQTNDYRNRDSTTNRYKLRSSHVCDECGQGFDRPSSLDTHKRIHTGERPFTCRYSGCYKAFAARSNMRRHERTHSANSAFAPVEDSDESGGAEGHLPSSRYPTFSTQPSPSSSKSSAK